MPYWKPDTLQCASVVLLGAYEMWHAAVHVVKRKQLNTSQDSEEDIFARIDGTTERCSTSQSKLGRTLYTRCNPS